MKALTRAQVREIDRRAIEEFGIPSLVLMENAARGATDILCALGIEGPVVICCGRGNNGGDGLAMARHLQLRGHRVRVLHWTPDGQWSVDAATQAAITAKCGIAFDNLLDQDGALGPALADADWILDALLGTGTQGPPRSPYDSVLRQLNEARAKKFAVDIPSGLDCDTGQVHAPTFRADHTCTFVAAKQGLLVPEAQAHVGQVHVTDIGAPRCLLDAFGL